MNQTLVVRLSKSYSIYLLKLVKSYKFTHTNTNKPQIIHKNIINNYIDKSLIKNALNFSYNMQSIYNTAIYKATKNERNYKANTKMEFESESENSNSSSDLSDQSSGSSSSNSDNTTSGKININVIKLD